MLYMQYETLLTSACECRALRKTAAPAAGETQVKYSNRVLLAFVHALSKTGRKYIYAMQSIAVIHNAVQLRMWPIPLRACR